MSILVQCLTRLAPRELRAAAARLFPGRTASWGRASDIIALVVEKLLDEEFLADLYQRLNEEEREILAVFAWMIGPYGIGKSMLKDWLSTNVPGRPLENLASLVDRGLVFETSSGAWGNWFMPEDLVEKFRLVMVRRNLPRGVPREGIPDNVFTGDFYEDCLTFLAYAHKNPVTLTQKGFIRKKTVGRLAALMQFKENTADIPAGLDYPYRFWLILNYCGFIKAIYFSDQMVRVQPEAVKQWLREKPLDMLVKATDYLWNVCVRNCPNAQIGALLTLIGQMKEDYWYGLADLATAAHRTVGPGPAGVPAPETFLETLLGTGLLVEGTSPEGERLVRLGFWSPHHQVREFPALPGEEDGFWVQPNFEVLAPPRLKPAVRWQLEMVADPVKVDHSITYAVTREAALRFLDRGGQVADMVGFLEKYSKNPLPQNVLFTVREWGALYGRVSFWDVFLLRCDDEHLADEIAGHPKLKAYVHGRFDHHHLIVSRQQYESLLEALQKQGYFPRKGIMRVAT